jgi:hypothetical protein
MLLLPPGYTGPVPEGHCMHPSGTNNVFIFLRSFYQEPKVLGLAVAVMEQTRICPLNGEATAKQMQHPNALGVAVNMPPTSDGRAFDQLKQPVDSEGTHLAEPDSMGSRDKPAQNAGGSTDIYFGPKAPKGHEGNWQATVPGRGYFAILRLYSPTEAAIDKNWQPGDIELVK